MILNFEKTVVLFGGSFDPPHLAHLALAQAARQALPQAQVVFVPCRESPGKAPPVAEGPVRVAWLRLLLQNEPFAIWETELQRSGPSYSVETLNEAHQLGATTDQLFWLVGADAYASLPHWKDSEKLRALCRFLVARRPGAPLPQLAPQDLLLELSEIPHSSTQIRSVLARGEIPQEGLPERLQEEFRKLFLLGANPYGKNK
jgi:nicotinate-nucleotide adenylyltransferase